MPGCRRVRPLPASGGGGYDAAMTAKPKRKAPPKKQGEAADEPAASPAPPKKGRASAGSGEAAAAAGEAAGGTKAGKGKGAKNGQAAGGFGARDWAREELLALHRQMLLLRRFEERAGQLYGLGKIGGFCHLYIGQEAVACGAAAAAGESDLFITSYRAHGHALALGTPPAAVMGELLGRANGTAGGKGGSMHLFDLERRFYGGHGIVAAQVPLGAGLAFAKKYRGEEGAVMVFLGDGALNQGQVYETFNMAALWGLPVLFIIENNRYGMGTSIDRSSARSEALQERGRGHGIQGDKADGMDIIAFHDAVRGALAKIKESGAPRILEALTYRYRGHSMSDPAKYRSRSEVEEVRSRSDPIDGFAARLIQAGLADEALLKGADAEVKAEVAASVEAGEAAGEPEGDALLRDVYAGAGPDAAPGTGLAAGPAGAFVRA